MALTNKLSAIGNAIREKTGKSDLLTLDAMPVEILSIQTGGETEEVVVSGSAFERWLFDGMMEYEDGTLNGKPIDYYNEIEEVYNSYVFSAFNAKSITLPNLIWESRHGTHLFYGNRSLVSVDIPKIKTLPQSCFHGCLSLKNINLPLVEKVSINGFNGCYALSSISLPQCKIIQGNVFEGCSMLKEVNFPLLEAIEGSNSFRFCPIENINFPLLKTTGDNSFENCNHLTEIILPELHTTGRSAFASCKELLYVNLPKIKTFDKNYVFSNCEKLKKVDLGSANAITVLVKGYSPFKGCKALETVILRNDYVMNLSMSAADIFADCTNIIGGTGFIYVPKALEADYKTSTNWAPIANSIRAIEDYPDICKEGL